MTFFIEVSYTNVYCIRHVPKMNKMLVPMFLLLLLLEMVISVMSVLNSVQVISFAQWKKTQNGELMCALDEANETMSSSLKDCSLSCARDAGCKGINIKNSLTCVICTGFNIKNSTTCDVYNYQPKIAALVPDCKFLQVATHFKISSLAFETYLTSRSLFVIHYMETCGSFLGIVSCQLFIA